MNCAECGVENPENANFCEECGNELVKNPVKEKNVNKFEFNTKSWIIFIIITILTVILGNVFVLIWILIGSGYLAYSTHGSNKNSLNNAIIAGLIGGFILGIVIFITPSRTAMSEEYYFIKSSGAIILLWILLGGFVSVVGGFIGNKMKKRIN